MNKKPILYALFSMLLTLLLLSFNVKYDVFSGAPILVQWIDPFFIGLGCSMLAVLIYDFFDGANND